MDRVLLGSVTLAFLLSFFLSLFPVGGHQTDCPVNLHRIWRPSIITNWYCSKELQYLHRCITFGLRPNRSRPLASIPVSGSNTASGGVPPRIKHRRRTAPLGGFTPQRAYKNRSIRLPQGSRSNWARGSPEVERSWMDPAPEGRYLLLPAPLVLPPPTYNLRDSRGNSSALYISKTLFL